MSQAAQSIDSTDTLPPEYLEMLHSYSWDPEEVYWPDITTGNVPNDFHKAVVAAETPEEWSHILKPHLSYGNAKVADNTAIWSIRAATECDNLGKDRCQVPKEACYAYKAEQNEYFNSNNMGPLSSKRRQGLIWDLLDGETFARALLEVLSRRSNESRDIEHLRLNESGDFGSRHEIHKFNRVAQVLTNQAGIESYTYSASSHLEWLTPEEREFTLNASNDVIAEHADRRFEGKFGVTPEDLSDNEVLCPAEHYGRDKVKCGDCRICINRDVADDGPDVIVPIHGATED